MPIQIPFPIPSKGFALNSKLRVNLDFLVDQFNQFNSGTATWDTVAIGEGNNLTGTLTFYNSSNTNYLTFQPGATGSSITYTLPATAPAVNNALLKVSSAGVMSWTDHSYAVTGASNGVLAITGGTTVDSLSNSLGGTGVLVSSTAGTPRYVTATPVSNQTSINIGATDFTIGTVQDIGTSSTPTFGRVIIGSGNAATPGVQFGSGTGIYGSSTAIDFTVAGTLRGEIDNAGFLAMTTEVRAPNVRGTTSLQVGGASLGNVTITTPSGGATYTLTLPPDDGTADYVLRTDGSGTTTWVSVGSTGGATKALDNLASVAINTTLVSDTDNTDDLGTTSIGWRSLYLATSIKSGSTTLATTTELGYLTGVTSAIQTQFSGKASTALSNLASVAINTTLVSDTNNTDDLGSSSIRWKDLYLSATLNNSATSNQIVLGTTRTVTLTAPTPATASRTITFPDLSGDYDVVGNIGTQSIAGAKTFSSAITCTAAASTAFFAQASNSGGLVGIFVDNTSNTADSRARLTARVAGTSAGDPFALFQIISGASWAIGPDNSDGDAFKVTQDTALGTSGDFITVTTAGSVVLNSGAISGSATDGFLYVASCNGVPSGTPTSFTGRIPIVYDSANNKLYAYNGTWKSVALT